MRSHDSRLLQCRSYSMILQEVGLLYLALCKQWFQKNLRTMLSITNCFTTFSLFKCEIMFCCYREFETEVENRHSYTWIQKYFLYSSSECSIFLNIYHRIQYSSIFFRMSLYFLLYFSVCNYFPLLHCKWIFFNPFKKCSIFFSIDYYFLIFFHILSSNISHCFILFPVFQNLSFFFSSLQ